MAVLGIILHFNRIFSRFEIEGSMRGYFFKVLSEIRDFRWRFFNLVLANGIANPRVYKLMTITHFFFFYSRKAFPRDHVLI